MTVQNILELKWKSFIRHPLLGDIFVMKIISLLGLFSIVLLLLVISNYFNQYYQSFFSETNEPLFFLCAYVFTLLFIDLVIKFIFKKKDIFNLSLKRFPRGNKSFNCYFLLKELISFWNCYLVIFMIPYFISKLYYCCGIKCILFVCLVLFAAQLANSLLVAFLKDRVKKVFLTKINTKQRVSSLQNRESNSILSGNLFERTIFSYILLDIKMICRSPRLRRLFIIYVLLVACYFYIIISKNQMFTTFFMSYSIILFILSLCSLFFNHLLFSAEASFFDCMMMLPQKNKIFLSRYICFIIHSFILFLLLLFYKPFQWTFFEFGACFLYSIGLITLLNFYGIIFVEVKFELYNSNEILVNYSVKQLLFSIISFMTSLFWVYLSYSLLGYQWAFYFMYIVGSISIVFSKYWFNKFFYYMQKNRYKIIEVFRIQ